MIFLWRESDPETCGKVNKYDDEYYKAMDEFEDKYGMLGEKLQTEQEILYMTETGGYTTVHFMDELSQYKEISDKHSEEEEKLDKYRADCLNEALDM